MSQEVQVQSIPMAEPGVGVHNSDLRSAALRLVEGATYRDLSTVCVVPLKSGQVDIRVEDPLGALIRPMNQPFVRLNMRGYEVGDAYNAAIAQVLANPGLKNFKFLLTVEHDNILQPDALVRLLRHMHASPYAGISGLYWTKGEGGMPMIYGDPREFPVNYRPQVPQPNSLQECRGIAMGCALWDMELFKDPKLPAPWFETKNDWSMAGGGQLATQDLWFCGKAVTLGYRFAVATDVLVGHLDFATGVVW